jgi:hypothetical protein
MHILHFKAESYEPTQNHHYSKLNMIPIVIFQISDAIFHGEDERAYQPWETKRILSPSLTPTINTGDTPRTLSFFCLNLHLPTLGIDLPSL